MAKCQTLGSSLVKDVQSSQSAASSKLVKKIKNKRKIHQTSTSGKANFQNRFISADPMSVVPQIHPHIPAPEERGPGYISREHTLPDLGMVHGRLMVSAWDYGLDEVQDDAARLLLQAVEHQLKNVLTAVLGRRNGYKVRDGRFKYAMGYQVPAPNLRSTLLAQKHSLIDNDPTMVTSRGVHMTSHRPSVELTERDIAMQMALCPNSNVKMPVSLFDMMEALQCNKSAIPSHTVYMNCMERIIQRLWHPTAGETVKSNKSTENRQRLIQAKT